MRELQVWYNGSDSVIAESKEDAAKVYEETTGESWEIYSKDGEAWELGNQENWKILYEAEEDRDANSPPNSVKSGGDGNYYYAKASQADWIEFTGRGWLCSENW